MEKKLEKLLKEIEKKKYNWNERSMFTLRGHKNLSMSDLDVLILYADMQLRLGNVQGLMRPVGPLRDILEGCGMKFNS